MTLTLDVLITILLPSLFAKLDSYLLYDGVSFLGLTAALFVIWFLYRRLF